MYDKPTKRERLIEDGKGYHTPLKDMRFDDLLMRQERARPLPRLPVYPPRKARTVLPLSNAFFRRRDNASRSVRSISNLNSSTFIPALSSIGIIVAGLYGLLHLLAIVLPSVSPDVVGTFTGTKVYDGRAIWGFALYAFAGLFSGIGIMFAWMKSGQS